MHIELLWFAGCPHHLDAERLLNERMSALGVTGTITRIEVPDEQMGRDVCFPGSPTIRVDGDDVEPGWVPCEDCTPRCRLYMTSLGLRGLPERAWIDRALLAAPGNGGTAA